MSVWVNFSKIWFFDYKRVILNFESWLMLVIISKFKFLFYFFQRIVSAQSLAEDDVEWKIST